MLLCDPSVPCSAHGQRHKFQHGTNPGGPVWEACMAQSPLENNPLVLESCSCSCSRSRSCSCSYCSSLELWQGSAHPSMVMPGVISLIPPVVNESLTPLDEHSQLLNEVPTPNQSRRLLLPVAGGRDKEFSWESIDSSHMASAPARLQLQNRSCQIPTLGSVSITGFPGISTSGSVLCCVLQAPAHSGEFRCVHSQPWPCFPFVMRGSRELSALLNPWGAPWQQRQRRDPGIRIPEWMGGKGP